MAIEFTEQQTRVLQARKHNILVSAAAGSGKTAVLVERIVRMISEGDEPMNIDRLLVVTFTKAAAAQMRERIGAAIAARIEEEPDNVHLQKQETLLHNAQITTMDSFFTFLLRNNFSDIDMDPGFRQMDQTEAELMRKDAMEEFLEEGYAQEDPSLKICADYFCRGAGDRELEEILETLYKQAVSHPDPVQWLRERALDYHVGSREELYSTAWMQFIILTVAEKIEDLKRQYERLLDYCSLPDGPALYIEGVKNNIAPYRGRIGYGGFLFEGSDERGRRAECPDTGRKGGRTMRMALLAGGFTMFRGLEKYIIVWIISVLISSIAQVMLKAEANKPHESRLKEYLNPMVIGAYGIFFLSTFLTMYALKYVPLTYSPIIEPLSYIFVPVIGVLVLKEKLSRRRVLGIVIMLAGIVIFSM